MKRSSFSAFAWKKALLAAAALTAFCGAVAFAAPHVGAGDHSMRAKAESILGHHLPPTGPDRPALAPTPGPKRGPGLRGHLLPPAPLPWEGMKAAREDWEKLSPAEKQAAIAEARARQQQRREECFEKSTVALSPAEKAQVKAYLEEDAQLREKHRSERETLHSLLQGLAPEQKEAIKAGIAKERKFRPHPAKPEWSKEKQKAHAEREAERADRHNERRKLMKQRYAELSGRLTPEQKVQVEDYVKADKELRSMHDEQREKLRARLQQLSLEQQEAVKAIRRGEKAFAPRPPKGPKPPKKFELVPVL